MNMKPLRLMAAVSVFVAGAILLFGPSRLQYPSALHLEHLSIVFDSLLSAAVFYASIGLLLGRRASWRVAIGILLTSAVWETIKSHAVISPLSLIPLLSLVVVASTHRAYTVPSSSHSIWIALRRALLVTLVTTVVASTTFFVLASHEHRYFSLWDSLLAALTLMYSPVDMIAMPHSHTKTHFVGHMLLAMTGVINYCLIAFALLKPVYDEFVLTDDTHERARALVARFGTSSEDYFKLFPGDKSYFFGQNLEGCIAYGYYDGIAVALADPICRPQNRPGLLAEFNQFCEQRGWDIAFLAVDEQSLSTYQSSGYETLKIGETAIVDLAHFCLHTATDKKFRNIGNRFTKQGPRVTHHTPPHAPALIDSVRTVSSEWKQRGHTERQFAMGYMSDEYLQASDLYCVYDKAGALQAFVNLQPSFSSTRASFDMMRAADTAAPNTMDFLFMMLFRDLKNRGWSEVDMGLAPLSGLERSRRAPERGLNLFYRYTSKWFAFRGLRRFKDKFDPIWHPTYLAYRAPAARLPAIGYALIQLMDRSD